MARPPDGNQPDRNETIRDPHEALECLVRLLARQLAREDFAASTRQGQNTDQSDSSTTGRAKDE